MELFDLLTHPHALGEPLLRLSIYGDVMLEQVVDLYIEGFSQ